VPEWPKGTDCKSVSRRFESARHLFSPQRPPRGAHNAPPASSPLHGAALPSESAAALSLLLPRNPSPFGYDGGVSSAPDDPRIARAVAGDADALTSLLQETAPRLRAQLSLDRRWQSVMDIDDVLQVTFLEAFLRIGAFEPGSPQAFFAWLRRIAENNLRDAVKGLEAAKRPPPAIQPASAPDSGSSPSYALGVTSATPSRAAVGREHAQLLNTALDALPPDYATVIRRYDLEGREIQDVATALKRSPGAVHMLRARAHDRLRELLGTETQFFTHVP
jgi:RNA polymerase sigma factor (sigma-70 family)